MERIIRIINSLDFDNDINTEYSFEQISNSFKQGTVDLPLLRRFGGGGNCATIALIKAAIGNFGFSGVFKSVIIDHRKKRFLIDLADSDETVYILKFKKFELASSKSAFILKSNDMKSRDILEFSNFCFAVMAEVKRNTYRRYKDYRRAITDLNKGEPTNYIFELLGLERENIKDISIKNLAKFKHLVVWNPPHAVYSNEGYYDEHYNNYDEIEPLERLKEIHGDGSEKYNPIGAYILKA